MSKEGQIVVKGIGLLDILLIVFIILKLTGTITWSWWWVLSPLWLPALILLVAFILFLAFKLIFD